MISVSNIQNCRAKLISSYFRSFFVGTILIYLATIKVFFFVIFVNIIQNILHGDEFYFQKTRWCNSIQRDLKKLIYNQTKFFKMMKWKIVDGTSKNDKIRMEYVKYSTVPYRMVLYGTYFIIFLHDSKWMYVLVRTFLPVFESIWISIVSFISQPICSQFVYVFLL